MTGPVFVGRLLLETLLLAGSRIRRRQIGAQKRYTEKPRQAFVLSSWDLMGLSAAVMLMIICLLSGLPPPPYSGGGEILI